MSKNRVLPLHAPRPGAAGCKGQGRPGVGPGEPSEHSNGPVNVNSSHRFVLPAGVCAQRREALQMKVAVVVALFSFAAFAQEFEDPADSVQAALIRFAALIPDTLKPLIAQGA